MTEGAHRTLSALAVALVCAAGGLFAFGLSLRMPPPPPTDANQMIDQILRSPETLAAVNSLLPQDASALVWQAPDVEAAPPSVTTGPGTDPNSPPDKSTGSGAEQSPDLPDAPEPKDPADDQDPGQPSNSAGGTSTAPVVQAGRTLIVSTRADYDAELERLKATSMVAERPRPDGTSLAIATPRTDRSTRTAAAVAGVAMLTGAVAATVIVLFWPAGRRGHAEVPPDDLTRSDGRRTPVPDPVPVPAGAGAPPGTGSPLPAPPGTRVPPPALPGPNGFPPVPPGTHGARPGLPAAAATPDIAPPDPQLATLRTQRSALIRGLANLAAKLPAEYEWQAANVLDAAGVRRIVPDGDAFDPASHHAVDTEPPLDARLDDTVARTLRPGWADGSQVVVPARVIVYALHSRRSSGPDDVAH